MALPPPQRLRDTVAAIAEMNCLATLWYRAESWQLLSELPKQATQTKPPLPDSARKPMTSI
jgi:hypothetical protein